MWISSIKGFPKVRTGSASDTIDYNHWSVLWFQSPTGCLVPLASPKKKIKMSKPPNNSLEEETLESLSFLVSLSVKCAKWLQSDLNPLQVFAHFTSVTKKENEAHKSL